MPTIVDKAAMNGNGSKPVTGRSVFPLNQRIAGTYRFGIYQPCYVEDTVPDDTLPVKSAHDVQSFNLKAPLLGDIKLHKEFFDVPYSVMLPLNYEKLFVQPNIGEDIDAQEIGTNIENLPKILSGKIQALASYLVDLWETEGEDVNNVLNDAAYLNAYMQGLISLVNLLSMTFSSGSLFSSLGLDISGVYQRIGVDDDTPLSQGSHTMDFHGFDNFIDAFWTSIGSFINAYEEKSGTPITFSIDSSSFAVSLKGTPGCLTLREFIERCYDSSKVLVDPAVLAELISDQADLSSYGYFIDSYNLASSIPTIFPTDASKILEKNLNIGKILAYQLVCAEFFTNSHVDYIYSAELYRQNVGSLLFDPNGFPVSVGMSRDQFSWNGVSYYYDILSAHTLSKALSKFTVDVSDVLTSTQYITYYNDLCRLLFGYNRSLRYVDYFTGSRTRPLAVGDVNVQVNDGYVNVVDTIQKRWFAKFLNQVNRAGRKLSEYTRAMFPGAKMSRDFHDPMWLAHITDKVDVGVTENTGAAQVSAANSKTANLYSNGERYAFEYRPERYGICIGILYFDISRYYSHIIERNNFNIDRNDFFNPFLQFVGDQKVYTDELSSGIAHNTFGYQGRDMQYKQKVDRAFGGFIVKGTLPGWLFLSKDDRYYVPDDYQQSPSFIRQWSSEFDEFYNALTGFSPSTYFHFIVINTNNVNASRPMVANPQLD